MSFVGAAILGAGALGAGATIYGASQQADANKQAQQAILQGQQQSLGAINQYLAPYSNFGQQLQPTLSSLLTPGPSQTETLSKLPGFQFARDLAGYGIAAGAGKTGISGSTAVAGGNLESALASEYFKTYTDPLVQLYGTGAGAGQTAATSAADINQSTAGNLAQLAVGQGRNLAGAATGVAGNLSNALLIKALTGGGNNPWGNAPVPAGSIPFLGGPFQAGGGGG